MKCAYCHTEIVSDNYLTEGHLVFCNSLCRYSWRKQSTRTTSKSRDNPVVFNEQTSEIEASIEAPGLEGRNLTVQSHFWTGAQLYVDGVKQKPFKNSRLTKAKFYNIQSNGGQNLIIKTVSRMLDPVPVVYINGQKYRSLARLKWYEYVWIAIPLFLLYIGGALGGFIGGLATLANARYFRSTRNTLYKYVMSGLTSAVSIFFFFQIAGWVGFEINRFAENQSLQAQISSSVYSNLNSSSKILAAHPWVITTVTDNKGKVLSDKLPMFKGVVRYFNPNGSFVQLQKTGHMYKGTWQLDQASRQLKISVGGDEVILQIHRLTDSKLTLSSDGVLFEHQTDE